MVLTILLTWAASIILPLAISLKQIKAATLLSYASLKRHTAEVLAFVNKGVTAKS